MSAAKQLDDEPAFHRAVTRADCEPGAGGPLSSRPCVQVCRHNLNYSFRGGTVKLRTKVGTESCALDVADRGPQSMREIAEALGQSHQAVDYTLGRALAKMRKRVGKW